MKLKFETICLALFALLLSGCFFPQAKPSEPVDFSKLSPARTARRIHSSIRLASLGFPGKTKAGERSIDIKGTVGAIVSQINRELEIIGDDTITVSELVDRAAKEIGLPEGLSREQFNDLVGLVKDSLEEFLEGYFGESVIRTPEKYRPALKFLRETVAALDRRLNG